LSPNTKLAQHTVCYLASWAPIMHDAAGRRLLDCGMLLFYFPSPSLSPITHVLSFMSHTHPTSASSSNFQLVFDNALTVYEKRTKRDLLTHPLAAQLQHCNSPSSILDVLQQQVKELNQSQHRDQRWTRWLDPTVKVLHTFSEKLGEGVTPV
jgi:hypothetical protein